MNNLLLLEDRCAKKTVCLRAFRSVVIFLVNRVLALKACDLSVTLVDDEEMAHWNRAVMGHHGTTDVITLDYCAGENELAGEIYICLPEARRQARRFHVSWQQEVARYVVHGMLHMLGYDDRKAGDRRIMKARESACLRDLMDGVRLSRMGRKTKARQAPPGACPRS